MEMPACTGRASQQVSLINRAFEVAEREQDSMKESGSTTWRRTDSQQVGGGMIRATGGRREKSFSGGKQPVAENRKSGRRGNKIRL